MHNRAMLETIETQDKYIMGQHRQIEALQNSDNASNQGPDRESMLTIQDAYIAQQHKQIYRLQSQERALLQQLHTQTHTFQYQITMQNNVILQQAAALASLEKERKALIQKGHERSERIVNCLERNDLLKEENEKLQTLAFRLVLEASGKSEANSAAQQS